jgi:hypothetical protein
MRARRYLHKVAILGGTTDTERVAREVGSRRAEGWTLLSTYTEAGQVYGVFETWEKVPR